MLFIDKHGEAAGAVMGALDGGDTSARLERYVGRLTGRSAVALSTADAALDTALFLCGVGFGDYVFVPTYTFYSYIATVAHTGAVPVFLDCDPTTRCVSQDALDAAFVWAELQQKPPKAVIVDNAFGAAADLDVLKPVCTARDVPLIELALDGLGTYKGKSFGSSGDYGVIGYDKRLFGGGSVLVLDGEKRSAALGFSRYEYSDGENHDYRMNGFLAALWLNQLEVSQKLDSRALKNLDALSKSLESVVRPAAGDAATYALVKTRRDMAGELRATGFDVKKPPPVHTLPQYADCHYFEHERGYSVSESFADHCLISTDVSALKRNKLIRALKHNNT